MRPRDRKIICNILPPEEFKRQYRDIIFRYKGLLDKNEENKRNRRFKKMGQVLIRMKAAQARDKIYAIKYLNSLEKYQPLFRDEERALVVKAVELLEKVILHKKRNKEW